MWQECKNCTCQMTKNMHKRVHANRLQSSWERHVRCLPAGQQLQRGRWRQLVRSCWPHHALGASRAVDNEGAKLLHCV
jgi:hypothetical protein